jgi:hypothetical protein
MFFSPTFLVNFFEKIQMFLPFELVVSYFRISQQCKILHKRNVDWKKIKINLEFIFIFKNYVNKKKRKKVEGNVYM